MGRNCALSGAVCQRFLTKIPAQRPTFYSEPDTIKNV